MERMNPANIRYLIIHCTATRDTQDYTVDRLERDHQKRGFETVGYHYYIRQDGAIHPLRKHHEVGAHTAEAITIAVWGFAMRVGITAKINPKIPVP